MDSDAELQGYYSDDDENNTFVPEAFDEVVYLFIIQSMVLSDIFYRPGDDKCIFCCASE